MFLSPSSPQQFIPMRVNLWIWKATECSNPKINKQRTFIQDLNDGFPGHELRDIPPYQKARCRKRGWLIYRTSVLFLIYMTKILLLGPLERYAWIHGGFFIYFNAREQRNDLEL